jgi:hypothetical protein
MKVEHQPSAKHRALIKLFYEFFVAIVRGGTF